MKSTANTPDSDELYVFCPRCDGEGDEPGAPVDWKEGRAICEFCLGSGVVSPERSQEYAIEMEDFEEDAIANSL